MLLIKNGRVLTMEGTTLPQGCVLIKGGKIKRVAPTIDETNLPRDHILDAQGGWIMPGLIESHCHIGITEANNCLLYTSWMWKTSGWGRSCTSRSPF